IDENKQKIVSPLIDEAVFLESQLEKLKEYPFIKSREIDGVIQTKQTAAGKMYREYLQTLTNIIDKLARIYGREESEELSPVEIYFKKKLSGEL
ncbi:MAG: hypothetical protein IKT34_02735, partial [Clostridia bacterium]|nr:hypothetical protein [Clostridia bacterium]